MTDETATTPAQPPKPVDLTRARVTRGELSKDQCYPVRTYYTWGEFAWLALEMGGYRDATAIDPYSGRRFWVPDVFGMDEHDPYSALRRVIDAMERERFLGPTAADRASDPGEIGPGVHRDTPSN